MRAGIQLAFFIAAPSLFSTAFAGIKSIFLAIAAGQPVEWNSFLTVTAVLLIFTCFFGRHFCGYACAFGSFGDAVYEGFSWIRMKCFHKKKKPALSEKMVHGLQKVKYIVLALILLSCLTGVYGKLTGTSPWDVFSRAGCGTCVTAKTFAGSACVAVDIQMSRTSFFTETTFRRTFLTVSPKQCTRKDWHLCKNRSHGTIEEK